MPDEQGCNCRCVSDPVGAEAGPACRTPSADGGPSAVPLMGLSGAELSGIGLTVLAWFIYTLHDAAVKHLVVSFPALQVIFFRCCVILLGCIVMGRRTLLKEVVESNHKGTLSLRAALMLTSSLLFYNAAHSLALAELTTLYFAGPLFMVGLGYLLLDEPLRKARVIAVLAGLLGVVIAVSPSANMPPLAVVCALGAAFTWALSMVLTRRIGLAESALCQVAVTNVLIVVATAVLVIPGWQQLGLADASLLLGVGIAAGLGQLTLTEATRRASVSLLAPFSYSSLIWAVFLGYVIWGDIPALSVFAGGSLIIGAGILVMLHERRLARPT